MALGGTTQQVGAPDKQVARMVLFRINILARERGISTLELIDQVLAYYDKLDAEIRTELPLKRIWVVSEAAG